MSEKKHFVRCETGCLIESMTKEQIVTAIVEATGNTPTLADEAFITQMVNQNGGSVKLWKGTTAEFNALNSKDADTYYIKTDAKSTDEAYSIATEAKQAAQIAENTVAEVVAQVALLEGNKIAEAGTSGSWTYIKYENGIAMCWGAFPQTWGSAASWDEKGALYHAEGSAETYPFEFTARPVCLYDKSTVYGELQIVVERAAGTVSKTPKVGVVKAGSGTPKDSTIGFFAIGNWK